MIALQTIAKSFSEDTRGATAIEYALIASLIAVALITAFTGLATKITTAFKNIGDKVATPT